MADLPVLIGAGDGAAIAAERSRLDRALDVLAALSVASWGVSVLVHTEGPPTSVRIALASLDGVVAMLFLSRGAAQTHAGARAVLASMPSIFVGALALRIAPAQWPLACELVFVLATILAITSLLALGRSFAILPARRAIVGRGPYRVVRHPAYACELAMTIAAGAASGWWIALVAGAVVGLTLVPRIRAEELLLADDEAWRGYAARVRWRLVPAIY